MLNIKSQLFAAVVLIAGSLGMTSAAFAGEGGIASSASFQLDTPGNVTQASVAVAVGKSTAYAGAATPGGAGTEAFATGTGGAINLGGSSIYIQSINAETAANLAVGQLNEINDNTVNIDVKAGNIRNH